MSRVSISPATLTEYSVIQLLLKPKSNSFQNKSYWKFNAELLQLEDGVREVKDLIVDIMSNEEFNTYCKKWKLLKYKIWSLAIKFSKIRHRKQREKEIKLVQEISAYCKMTVLTNEDKEKLSLTK